MLVRSARRAGNGRVPRGPVAMDTHGLISTRGVVFTLVMLIAFAMFGYSATLFMDRQSEPGQARRSATPAPPAAQALPIVECSPAAPVEASESLGVFLTHRVDLRSTTGVRGLAYLPAARTMALAQAGETSDSLVQVTLYGDVVGTSGLAVDRADALATGTASAAALIVLEAETRTLHLVNRTETGQPADVIGVVDLGAAWGGKISSLDLDPTSDTLVLADAENRRLLRIPLRVLARGSSPVGVMTSACALPVTGPDDTDDLLVAVRPTDGHLFVTGPTSPALFELNGDGQVLSKHDWQELDLGTVRGLAFAPSADPTDAEDIHHLYALTEVAGSSSIHALSFSPPPSTPSEASQVVATVVNRIETGMLQPPSSDPGGVAYDTLRERLIVTDSDIDELPEFGGHTVFALGADGIWRGLGKPRTSDEITDVALDPDSDRWYFSDDGRREILEMVMGADDRFGTGDDQARVISTESFGSLDPEGIAFGQGTLFISDGVAAEVYRLSPGADGAFNGLPPDGDDEVSSFDTSSLGISDPEGVAFDPERGSLYLRSRDRREPIIEVATDGTLLSTLPMDREAFVSPGGIGLAPALDGSGTMHLFVADRGTDNAGSATPNDGVLLEIRLERPTGRQSMPS